MATLSGASQYIDIEALSVQLVERRENKDREAGPDIKKAGWGLLLADGYLQPAQYFMKEKRSGADEN